MPEHRQATLQKMALGEYTKACTNGFGWFLFNQVYIRDVKADGSESRLGYFNDA